jgi:site-specific recombinase XerD
MEARPWRRVPGKVTYRYHPAGGRPISLGTDRDAAIRAALDLIGRADDTGTVGHYWRLYKQSPSWRQLRERSQADYDECSKALLKVFERTHLAAIRPSDIARYLRRERASAPVRANREIALLSNLYELAIENGDVQVNPCRQVRRNKERPRKTMPVSEEFSAFTSWLRSRSKQWGVIAAMAEFAAKSGNRRTEFLNATVFQVKGVEARLARAKQRDGTEIVEVIELSPQAISILNSIDRGESTFLFPTRFGTAYTDAGFKAMWSNAKAEAIRRGIITRNFTFHDLRAHFASEYKRQHGELPDLHKNPATTARVYDRNVEVRRKSL